MEKWVIKNKKGDHARLAKETGLLPVTAKLLCNRGISDSEAADGYLEADYGDLYSPFDMKGMADACSIIREAIGSGQKLMVVGDYDVDGVTATYILESGLIDLGGDVISRIPDRIKDGYGINESIIREAHAAGVSLIITCDNGIRAVDEIRLAYELGMRVIITDHHDVPDTVPKADVILNPKYAKCRYPYMELCGAVVALKLIEALNCRDDEKRNTGILKKYIEIAATATVCDVVELREENRSIVKLGLEKFRNAGVDGYSVNPGMLELMNGANVSPENMNTYSLGFVIGPCINAGGRLDTALKGLELLRGRNAAAMAAELLSLNIERRKLTGEAVERAEELIQKTDALKDRVLVLHLEGCHESIAGIVAGRVREKHDRPVIILTDSGNALKGSARSIEGYNITAELEKCSDLLLHFGGHAMAAGMTLEKKNLEEFRSRLNSNCTLTEDALFKKISIDLVMPAVYASVRLCHEIELLEPFGNGNPEPLFAEKNCEVIGARTIGKEGKYLKFKLKSEEGSISEFVYFGSKEDFEKNITDCYGQGALKDIYQGIPCGLRLSVTYSPEINLYNGNESVSLKLKNYLL